MALINLQDARWCDMVFADRNKEYGAYVLRRENDKTTLIAFLTTILLFSAGLSFPYLWDRFHNPTIDQSISIGSDVIDLFDPTMPPDVPIPDVPVPHLTSLQQTIAFHAYEIVPDQLSRGELHSLDEIAGAVIGSTDQTGVPGTGEELLPQEGGGIIDGGMEEILLDVQLMPEFPGGEAAMMSYISTHFVYPASAIEEGVKGIVFVNFVIEKDGSISHVGLADPNRRVGLGCDEEALRVIASMPRWKPGSQNGEKKRVQFTIPIKLELQ